MHVIYTAFTANLPFPGNLHLVYKPHSLNSTADATRVVPILRHMNISRALNIGQLAVKVEQS